jgi:phage terminase small subunit
LANGRIFQTERYVPVLENARHERFAQELAKGASQTDAYIAAGYRGDRTAASRLATKVNNRVAELKGAAAEKSELDMSYVLTTIHDTVERCKQARPVLDRKGDPVLTELPTGDVAPAYAFDAKSVLRGAELIGKHLGMFTEKIEHSGPDGGPIELADNDLARLIVFQLTKASRQTEQEPSNGE